MIFSLILLCISTLLFAADHSTKLTLQFPDGNIVCDRTQLIGFDYFKNMDSFYEDQHYKGAGDTIIPIPKGTTAVMKILLTGKNKDPRTGKSIREQLDILNLNDFLLGDRLPSDGMQRLHEYIVSGRDDVRISLDSLNELKEMIIQDLPYMPPFVGKRLQKRKIPNWSASHDQHRILIHLGGNPAIGDLLHKCIVSPDESFVACRGVKIERDECESLAREMGKLCGGLGFLCATCAFFLSFELDGKTFDEVGAFQFWFTLTGCTVVPLLSLGCCMAFDKPIKYNKKTHCSILSNPRYKRLYSCQDGKDVDFLKNGSPLVIKDTGVYNVFTKKINPHDGAFTLQQTES